MSEGLKPGLNDTMVMTGLDIEKDADDSFANYGEEEAEHAGQDKEPCRRMRCAVNQATHRECEGDVATHQHEQRASQGMDERSHAGHGVIRLAYRQRPQGESRQEQGRHPPDADVRIRMGHRLHRRVRHRGEQRPGHRQQSDSNRLQVRPHWLFPSVPHTA